MLLLLLLHSTTAFYMNIHMLELLHFFNAYGNTLLLYLCYVQVWMIFCECFSLFFLSFFIIYNIFFVSNILFCELSSGAKPKLAWWAEVVGNFFCSCVHKTTNGNYQRKGKLPNIVRSTRSEMCCFRKRGNNFWRPCIEVPFVMRTYKQLN